MIVIALILVTAAAAALGAGFAAVVIGIHLAERRKAPPGSSGRRADVFARRVLRANVRQPGAGSRCPCGAAGHRGRRAAGHAR